MYVMSVEEWNVKKTAEMDGSIILKVQYLGSGI